MTLTLKLPADLQLRLANEAKRRGLAPDTYTLQLLEKSLPPNNRRAELATLLQSWIDDPNPQDQQETGEHLIRALDDDRLADRQLFPPERKHVTWSPTSCCSMRGRSVCSPIHCVRG